MTIFTLTIDTNPLPKQRPRLGKYATYTPKRTSAYEKQVAYAIKARMAEVGLEPFTGDVSLALRFYRKDNRNVDLDNLIKACLDAANGILWIDDRQIVEIHATMQKGCKNQARVEIAVKPFTTVNEGEESNEA